MHSYVLKIYNSRTNNMYCRYGKQLLNVETREYNILLIQ